MKTSKKDCVRELGIRGAQRACLRERTNVNANSLVLRKAFAKQLFSWGEGTFRCSCEHTRRYSRHAGGQAHKQGERERSGRFLLHLAASVNKRGRAERSLLMYTAVNCISFPMSWLRGCPRRVQVGAAMRTMQEASLLSHTCLREFDERLYNRGSQEAVICVSYNHMKSTDSEDRGKHQES